MVYVLHLFVCGVASFVEADDAGDEDGGALEVLDAAGYMIDADADGLGGGVCKYGVCLGL